MANETINEILEILVKRKESFQTSYTRRSIDVIIHSIRIE